MTEPVTFGGAMIPIDRWPGRIRGIGRGAPNTGPASTASTV
jgi:hypothetical protein